MKKSILRAILSLLLLTALIFAAGCAGEQTKTWKVTFCDSDGVTVIKEVEVEDGKPLADPELTKDGYLVEGYYATPALLVPFVRADHRGNLRLCCVEVFR